MPFYFDNNATTPLDPRVRDAMLPWLEGAHGNPSSAHSFGRAARAAVERARSEVAALLGTAPATIIFTASGTEANNAVLHTTALACSHRGHLVTTTLEHPSVRVAASQLVTQGMEVSEVPPAADGVVPPPAIAAALQATTRLVCLMRANNELGTLQPVAEVATMCREQGVPVLCDAVQAVGKVPVSAAELGVDYLTIGGHKFHAPLGVAALYVRDGAPLMPLLVGGGQEGGRRASTENVAAIVGLGTACALVRAELTTRQEHLDALRARFESGLAVMPGARLHCAGSPRLPHTSHVAFVGASGQALAARLDAAGFAVSTGAACHDGKPSPSAALLAMGVSADEALASLRISFGMTNTTDEVDALLAALTTALRDAG